MAAPDKKPPKALMPRDPGAETRRNIVMQWIISGCPGTVAMLASRLRRGVQVGTNTDGSPRIRQYHTTTKKVLKDITTIRRRWAEDEKIRVGKQEYMARSNDLFNRAYRIAQGLDSKDTTQLEKLAALRVCRELLVDMEKMDGHLRPDVSVAGDAVFNIEHKTLNVWLGDKENAVVPVDAELVSD